MVHAQDPKIVFLSGTWSTKDQMEHLHDKLDFDGLFTIPNDGRDGGLELLWKATEKCLGKQFFELPYRCYYSWWFRECVETN